MQPQRNTRDTLVTRQDEQLSAAIAVSLHCNDYSKYSPELSVPKSTGNFKYKHSFIVKSLDDILRQVFLFF